MPISPEPPGMGCAASFSAAQVFDVVSNEAVLGADPFRAGVQQGFGGLVIVFYVNSDVIVTIPYLFEEGRVAPTNDNIKIISKVHIRITRVAGFSDVATERVTHQNRHWISDIVGLVREVHLGDQPR